MDGKGDWSWFSERRSPLFIPRRGNRSPDDINKKFQNPKLLFAAERGGGEEKTCGNLKKKMVSCMQMAFIITARLSRKA